MARKPNPALTYLARLRPSGRRTQRQALIELASMVLRHPVKRLDLVGWGRFRYSDSAMVVSVLAARVEAGKLSHRTANRWLSAWRMVLQEAWLLGQMPTDEYSRARVVRNIRGQSPKRGRWLTHDEKEALVDACLADGSPLGLRDVAVLALGLLCGLRRQAMVDLDMRDVDLTGDSLIVHEKGDNTARLSIGPARELLVAWLDERGDGSGPLLLGGRRVKGVIRLVPGVRMSSQAVYVALAKRSKQAGIGRVTPHDLRKTYATDMLALGVDVLRVQQLLLHKDPKTTAIYDLRGEIELRQAQGRLRLPARTRKDSGGMRRGPLDQED